LNGSKNNVYVITENLIVFIFTKARDHCSQTVSVCAETEAMLDDLVQGSAQVLLSSKKCCFIVWCLQDASVVQVKVFSFHIVKSFYMEISFKAYTCNVDCCWIWAISGHDKIAFGPVDQESTIINLTFHVW